MGWGNFQLARIFFSLTACARIFFQRNIAFFLTVKSWFIIYVFVLHKLFYTHNRSKDTGSLMQNLFENVHTVRKEEATWSGRLPCAFFQSLPSGIPLPQPIIMMPYSIHQNSPSVVPSTPKYQSKKIARPRYPDIAASEENGVQQGKSQYAHLCKFFERC